MNEFRYLQKSAVTEEIAESPEVSIVIAVLNAAKTISVTLDSVIGQQNVHKEVLLIDGLSIDGTWQIIQDRASRIDFMISEADSGIYEAWNKALEHARGEYICFMGADDQFANPGALRQLLDATKNRPDLVTCLSVMQPNGQQTSQIHGGPWHWKRLTTGMCIENRGALHHTGLFTRLGYFDTSFRISGDYEFLLRAGPHIHAVHLNETLVEAGTTGISESQPLRRIKEAFRAQNIHLVRPLPVLVSAFLYKLIWILLHSIKATLLRIKVTEESA